jgi:membrane-bound ClpP family serine protease
METLKELIFGDYKVYFAFAVLGSMIALVQLILSFFFGGGDFDVDGDGDVELGEHLDSGFGDFRFISFRSLVAFFAFFGWGGVISYENGIKGFGAFFIALVFGLIMMFVTALLLYFMLKMQHSGNIDPDDVIGSLGTVYLRIPGGRADIGKVTAEVKGTSQEIVAVADEEIPRGCSVKIIEQVDGKRYLVEKV